MDPNPSLSDKQLPAEIQKALEQHAQTLRLAHLEIASGINRLLHQGIPKEVVSQVLSQAVEALAKEVPANHRRTRP
jgi:membrane-associated HD superfamily phosphohydrolase